LAVEPTFMSDRKGHNGVTQDGTATTLTAQEKERPIVAAADAGTDEENRDWWGSPEDQEREANDPEYYANSVVRRLTPTECARLQGYPDDWCDLGDWTDTKGRVHKDADSPKYKAYGNSIAVGFANNCSGFWMWMIKRISAQYERNATLGSLFDGIGGFDLAWAKYNGPENCRWSSEIEEFPIAVVKKHFGDEETGQKGDIAKYLYGK